MKPVRPIHSSTLRSAVSFPAVHPSVNPFLKPFLNPSIKRLLRQSVCPLLSAATLLLAAAPAMSADLAAGEKLATERCAACHGKDGNTPIDPSYPRIAGQHEDYLAQALRAYQQDKRKHAIMGAQAKLLSRDDILNLAAYYSRLPGMMSHDR
jgi:cytochrome c553